MRVKYLAGLVLAGLLGFVSSTSASDQTTLFDAIKDARDLTVFAVAVKETGQDRLLRGEGPMTVFAPTDAAFDRLGDDRIRAIVKDKEFLKKIVLAHVVTRRAILQKDLAVLDGKELNGFKVAVTKAGTTIGGAKIVRPDAVYDKNVLHVTDTVLIPAE